MLLRAVLLAIIAVAHSHELKAQAATLTTWDGAREVSVVNFVAGKHLVVRDAVGVTPVSVTDMVELRFAANPSSVDKPRSLPLLWMETGGWLSVSSVESADNRLTFESELAGAAKCDIDRVSAIAFQQTAVKGAAAAELKRYLKEAPKSDVLIIGKEGELVSLEGVFMRLDEKVVVFRWRETEQTVARERVIALVFAPVKRAPVNNTEAVSVLGKDGSSLQGLLRDLNNDAAVLEVAGLGRLSIPLSRLSAIDLICGRSVYVSSLEPVKVEQTPYFDHVFQFRRDESVGGKPISLGGVRYERGLGVHSRCALTYALSGNYRRLTGVVGIDDEVGKLGDVVFRVVADGKELFNSGNIRGGDAPRRLALNVTGLVTLTLEVDFGADMDIGDHADWADLKLVK
jgi:hypothetical protein